MVIQFLGVVVVVPCFSNYANDQLSRLPRPNFFVWTRKFKTNKLVQTRLRLETSFEKALEELVQHDNFAFILDIAAGDEF